MHKTIRNLRELLNDIYVTYGMTKQLPTQLLNRVLVEIANAEPKIVDRAVLGNDIVLQPEPKNNRCVHTEHCCILHGCKYGDGDECPVENKTKSQSHLCEFCFDDPFGYHEESYV